MASDFDPSSALATLAGTVHLWRRKGYGERWANLVEEQVEAEIVKDPPLREPAWRLTPAELAERVEDALKLCDRRVIPDETRFGIAIRAINLLDDWHEPLAALDFGLVPPTTHHVKARLRLGSGRGYNENETWGLIIPRSCPGMAEPAARLRSRLPNSVLHATTYVPPVVEAGDPDDPALDPLGRMVSVRYIPRLLLNTDAPVEPGVQPTIAVAPVHQSATDAGIVTFSDPERYGIEVRESAKRLPEILDLATRNQADVLFLPEMAIDESSIPALATLLRELGAAFVRENDRLPTLRYVVAGCVSKPDPAEFGRNFVIVMDREGSVVLKQNKLSRWNLKAHHRFSYGLSAQLDENSPDLFENIEEGDSIWIADLHGFGRFITLICADLFNNEPGDFLLRNVDVDWLHAPIMDKTNAVTGRSITEQPWTIKRAYRAATEGAKRVIVTNSILFTLLVNKVNSQDGSKFLPFPKCTIAFLLDCTDSKLHFRELSVDMPPADTIVCSAKWKEKFGRFPP